MAFDPATVIKDYGDAYAEAAACRSGAALFDFSFVARGRVCGPCALTSIAHVTRRPIDDLGVGRIRYATVEDANGHLVADLTIWRTSDDSYEVMSGREADIAELVRSAPDGTARDLTSDSAIFSVQGPGALWALMGLCDVLKLARIGYYAASHLAIAGIDCLVGRLGYTGEAGFEIIAPRMHGRELWSLLAARARPAGFAAADTLRIEAGFVLFANEFRMPVRAPEAGLAAFSSREARSVPRDIELICFSARTVERPVLWQPPPRLSRPCAFGELVITSACHSPIAGRTLGLGFVSKSTALSVGAPLFDPGGTFADIRREPRPFYDNAKLRPRASWQLSPR